MAPSAAASTPQTRIPKLKYRNPLPADHFSPSAPEPATHASPPPSDAASILSRPSLETASLTSSSLASTHSSNGSSSEPSSATKKKKKASSVFGFLSLKEPSQVALEQFAQQQRKQGPGKPPSSSASSIKANSITSKKLPPTVPKVTSKWDGIPSAAKHRKSISSQSSSESRTLSLRNSKNSQLSSIPFTDSTFSVMTDASQNPPNSIASPAPSVIDVDLHQRAYYVPSSPPVTTPDVFYYSPDESVASDASPESSSASDTPSGTIAGPPPSLPFSATSDDTPPDEYVDFRAPSPASSTDSADTIVRDTADAIFKKLNDGPHQNYMGASPSGVSSSEEDTDEYDQEEGGVPESHDFLFDIPPTTEQPYNNSPTAPPSVPHYTPRRPMRNFSRLMHTPTNAMPPPPPRVSASSSFRLKPASPGLPTLYEGSVASTESFETVRDNSDAQSVAASSIAPSELSQQWYQNPRDRLGLGGRLRKGDAPRWKNLDEEEPLGKPKKNLLSFLVRSRS